jgi:NAD-dependent SIR2 family protein deacetylase
VVWFGEQIPPTALEASLAMLERCDLLLVAGTSSVVQPSASFAFSVAQRGGTVIEVNLEETPVSGAARFSFRGRTGELLPAILAGADPP